MVRNIESKNIGSKTVDGVTYKKLSPWAVIATLAMGVFIYVVSLPTPGLAAIAAAFPDVDMVAIQQIVTLPSIFTVVGSFMIGPLSKVVNRKLLFTIVMFAVLISGVMPAIIPDFTLMLISRALIGIARGAAMTMALTFKVALFAPGLDRDRVMGWGMCVGAVGGVAFQSLGGVLATEGWQMPFWGTLIIIPLIIYCCFLLPDPGKAPKAEKTDSGKSKGGFTVYTWAIIIVGFIAAVFFFSFMTNMSLVVVNTGIGDPALAGLFMSTFMVGSFVNGLVVQWVKGLLKSYYFGTSFLCMGIALLILIAFPYMPAYFVGAFIFGIGFGILNVEISIRLADSCPPSSQDMALAVYSGVNGVGDFVSPFVLVPLAAAIGLQGPLAYWQISMPALMAIAIICYIVQSVANSKKKQKLPDESL